MNEADIQHQIVDWLRQSGWFVAVTSQKGFSFATPGLPDVIAVKKHKWPVTAVHQLMCVAPRTLWIEVKGPRGKQRPEQKAFQEGLEAQYGEYLLANSLDVVMEYLK